MRMPRSERILYTGVGYCLFVTWAYQSLLPDKLTTPRLNRYIRSILFISNLYKNRTLRFDTIEFP